MQMHTVQVIKFLAASTSTGHMPSDYSEPLKRKSLKI